MRAWVAPSAAGTARASVQPAAISRPSWSWRTASTPSASRVGRPRTSGQTRERKTGSAAGGARRGRSRARPAAAGAATVARRRAPRPRSSRPRTRRSWSPTRAARPIRPAVLQPLHRGDGHAAGVGGEEVVADGVERHVERHRLAPQGRPADVGDQALRLRQALARAVEVREAGRSTGRRAQRREQRRKRSSWASFSWPYGARHPVGRPLVERRPRRAAGVDASRGRGEQDRAASLNPGVWESRRASASRNRRTSRVSRASASGDVDTTPAPAHHMSRQGSPVRPARSRNRPASRSSAPAAPPRPASRRARRGPLAPPRARRAPPRPDRPGARRAPTTQVSVPRLTGPRARPAVGDSLRDRAARRRGRGRGARRPGR